MLNFKDLRLILELFFTIILNLKERITGCTILTAQAVSGMCTISNLRISFELHFYKRHFICGPSTASIDCCPAGARTVGPCSHGAAVILMGCVLPTHPNAYKPSHRTQNILGPCPGEGFCFEGEMIIMYILYACSLLCL